MKDRPSRRPKTSGPHFESLETRALLSHASAAAIHAHLAHLAQGGAAQVATPLDTSTNGTPSGGNTTGGGGNNLGPGNNTGQFQPVKNTYTDTDIYSNYIGGSIGLQAFVDGLYYNVLHRAPDSTGEQFWVGTLESGRYTPYTVVSEFLISAEGTSAGTGGQALRPSHPPANVYTGYLGGPIGVKAFVDGLYYDVLQRTPDPAGVAYWTNQIEQHDLLPAKITFSFLASAEYQNAVNGLGGATG